MLLLNLFKYIGAIIIWFFTGFSKGLNEIVDKFKILSIVVSCIVVTLLLFFLGKLL